DTGNRNKNGQQVERGHHRHTRGASSGQTRNAAQTRSQRGKPPATRHAEPATHDADHPAAPHAAHSANSDQWSLGRTATRKHRSTRQHTPTTERTCTAPKTPHQ